MTSFVRSLTRWKRKEILEVLGSARLRFRESGISIRWVPHSGEHGKLLVIAPVAMGNSPERNKIRRQIKAIFYENRLYTRGFHWIVKVYPSVKALEFSELLRIFMHADQQVATVSSSPSS